MARIRKSYPTATDKKDTLWKIALYLRLSREDTEKEDFLSESIQNQQKIGESFIQKTFSMDKYTVDLYIDDGVSGTTNYERKDFQRLITDIENKKINCVVVKSLHRAFRNYSDQGYFLETFFPLHNVRFINLGTPRIDTFLDPTTIHGLDVPMHGIMNDRYALNTSIEVRRVFDAKRTRGEFIGAFAPYGYEKDPLDKNHLIKDQEVSQVVTDIFYWFKVEGYSMNGIAKKLNELGIPNPTKYKTLKGFNYKNSNTSKNSGLWTASTIKRILTSLTYVGHMVQGKEKVLSYKVHKKISIPQSEWIIVPHTHEPYHSQDSYDTIQCMLKRDTKAPVTTGKFYLFSGLLRCADCDKAMIRTTVKKQYIYYHCRTYRDKSKEKCTKHTIRLEVLKEAVLNAIQLQIGLIRDLSPILDEIQKSPLTPSKSEYLETLQKTHKHQLLKNQEILDGIFMDWKNGDIDKNQYNRMKIKLQKQIEHLQNNIHNFDIQCKEKDPLTKDFTKETTHSLCNFLEYKNIKELDRGILTAFINTIYVHENGDLTIKFNFQDPYKKLLKSLNDHRQNE